VPIVEEKVKIMTCAEAGDGRSAMKLTRVEELALRLTVALAREGRQLTLTELAGEENLTEATVAKILGRLRRAGIVNATRGRSGGYVLALAPEKLPISRVLGALGTRMFDSCATHEKDSTRHCPHLGDCGLRPLLTQLQREFSRVLGGIRLADLVHGEGVSRRQVMRQTAGLARER
jgi:Rrf2 family nitric oxide-sensitive transcriptional repressor